jgi:hypothetical protein
MIRKQKLADVEVKINEIDEEEVVGSDNGVYYRLLAAASCFNGFDSYVYNYESRY